MTCLRSAGYSRADRSAIRGVTRPPAERPATPAQLWGHFRITAAGH
ncbi:hypothetical protein EYF80_060076 [Liparis tanakae]|uniref:Uncharacterized protein n=1 Tax=Liparis tanakae TaxID=230148 RepID=A0A4Z2ELX9_9TELE|nr:hypothetical protein EYF80_060076 [Liparis tanakae]